MRVVYVCSDPGIPVFGTKGASLHVRAVLGELLRRGCEVHLICARRGEGSPGAAAGLIKAGLTVHELPRMSGPREAAAQAGDAAVAPVLTRIQADAPVDLVYERYSLWGRTATAWAAEAGVPSILEVNAPLPAEASTYRDLHDVAGATEVARSAISAAGTVICVSDPVRSWASALTDDPARVHTVPNGVDTRRIHPGSPRESESFTTGFVGTLKPWHGVDVLIQAMAQLVQRNPAHRLLVVGDGPQHKRLQALTDHLGITANVEFTGAVAESAVPELLQRMDVACAPYPAGVNFYFSPLKVYEYLAAGLPVVASRIGSLPELLSGSGILVTPGEADDLAEAIDGLRVDPRRRAEMSRVARETALQHDWAAVVDRIVGLGRVDVQI
ncbi:glycosyl transferase [Kineosporia sp. NBRC 101677]|uniref:glycosyltransferase family 4 protein n=1 Tax=Kineosporia sp. NBRC 101677 TaxID=3032197 RepID=UPI0024A29993|nr:glycosyltransferase family 4 protein [Kineosporia sp. NBRC 101677]GLY16977.1 glycosyl transferase [Kineosporia sp. NBRC 101677]